MIIQRSFSFYIPKKWFSKNIPSLSFFFFSFASFAIANMASSRGCLNEIMIQGGVTSLLALAVSTSAGAQCLAISSLRRLSTMPENTNFLVCIPSFSNIPLTGQCV